ncbi:ATP-binding cassette domain-containing protein [Limimaricola pyoseonensis]|uniref:Phosphonate transport system ATP-binding protein n=1 Tax=Limimaricola pyoseonensis TaxID=521013 RepID=A0A1G7K958_9RHOB|nr:ATP-binding cassette domain-containing protein [Limimaricola pyoseonensis]SDF33561.1 phosphonate transport system ATP-binding protein [Limimaricola pyoseonensis]
MQPRPLARFEGETLSWDGAPVLHDVTLSLCEGERLVLLGHSGSGKSTLLNAIRLKLEAARPAPRIALVPQDPGLVPQLSVFHNVWMGGLDDRSAAYGLLTLLRPPARERARLAPVIERVGLSGFERRRVASLSGGQKQRTALARALMRGGAALIADEPVSAVDPRQSGDLLAALSDRFPTMALALHDPERARALATRIVGLKAGRIVFDRPAAELSLPTLHALYGH